MPELHELLERATTGLEPDIGSLVRGGRERGVRARARRRRGATAVGIAAAAALAVGAWLVPGLVDSGSPGGHAAVPATSAHPLPTPHQVSTMLGKLLPEGTAKPIRAWGKDGFYSAASWSLDTPGPGGPGRVTVQVKDESQQPDRLAQDPLKAARVCGTDATCIDTSDGDSLVISTEPVRGNNAGVIRAEVIRVTSDGFAVVASAYNAVKDQGPTTGEKPALNTDQLQDIVTDSGWLG